MCACCCQATKMDDSCLMKKSQLEWFPFWASLNSRLEIIAVSKSWVVFCRDSSKKTRICIFRCEFYFIFFFNLRTIISDNISQFAFLHHRFSNVKFCNLDLLPPPSMGYLILKHEFQISKHVHDILGPVVITPQKLLNQLRCHLGDRLQETTLYTLAPSSEYKWTIHAPPWCKLSLPLL